MKSDPYTKPEHVKQNETILITGKTNLQLTGLIP